MNRQKENYQYYKRIGICPKCKKAKPFGNFVHCEKCLEEIQNNNLKYVHKRREYNKKRAEKKKIRYMQRKADGVCVTCGERKASNGIYCNRCYWKRRNYRYNHERTGRTYGEAFRERMSEGLCMYCGKPQVAGYKFCEEHLETQKRKGREMSSFNTAFKREDNAFWKNASKNSKST